MSVGEAPPRDLAHRVMTAGDVAWACGMYGKQPSMRTIRDRGVGEAREVVAEAFRPHPVPVFVMGEVAHVGTSEMTLNTVSVVVQPVRMTWRSRLMRNACRR